MDGRDSETGRNGRERRRLERPRGGRAHACLPRGAPHACLLRRAAPAGRPGGPAPARRLRVAARARPAAPSPIPARAPATGTAAAVVRPRGRLHGPHRRPGVPRRPDRRRRAVPALSGRCRAGGRGRRGGRARPSRDGVPARRAVEHGDEAARQGDRRVDLPGVRAELEALRAEPAPAEHRGPGARGCPYRGRHDPYDRLVRPVGRGRRGHRRQSAAEPHRAERAAPGLGLPHRHARQRQPPDRPARHARGDVSAAHRRPAPGPGRRGRKGRPRPARPGPLPHHQRAPPEWSDEQVSTTPQYRLLPWWAVPADEAAGGVR